MTSTVQFLDDNGRTMAVGQNYHDTPRIGESVYSPVFKTYGHPDTMVVFNVVWDMSQPYSLVRIYLKRR